MRFLGSTLADESAMPTEPPPPELYEEMGRFVEEATRAGIVVATGGILPTAMGAIVSLKDGEFTVVDGPFTEAKELARTCPSAVSWSSGPQRRRPVPAGAGRIPAHADSPSARRGGGRRGWMRQSDRGVFWT